jgi:alkaline phosphatase D
MERRRFLQLAAAGGGVALAGRLPFARGEVPPAAVLEPGPFQYGVAAGDPLPHRLVLWTRLTPDPSATPGSGLGAATPADWEVATDPAFTGIVASGQAVSDAARDHTIKVDATGLDPNTRYWYRFRALGATSTVGRARTAPAEPTRSVRFGMVSCSNFEAGFFTPYRMLAARNDLDFVLHLGDYIYEYGRGVYGPGPAIGRPHEPPGEIITVDDYRRRYACYRGDRDLRALHAAHGFINTLDDHEVADNSWRNGANNHQPGEGSYAARRAAGYQAMLEWLPIRPPVPTDPLRVYRRLSFGNLVDVSVLDLRQYRDEPIDGQGPSGAIILSDEPAEPDRTITGGPQGAWLRSGLANSGAAWKLVATSVMIAPLLVPPVPEVLGTPIANATGLMTPHGIVANGDQWDGYQAEQNELLRFIAANRIDDVVFLTGDIHSAWGNDLPIDPGLYPVAPSVATEYVCTSITSDNLADTLGVPPGPLADVAELAFRTLNRHVRYLDGQHYGCCVVDATPARLRVDFHVTSDRLDRNATMRREASLQTVRGSNRVTRASGALGAR